MLEKVDGTLFEVFKQSVVLVVFFNGSKYVAFEQPRGVCRTGREEQVQVQRFKKGFSAICYAHGENLKIHERDVGVGND